MTTLMPKTPQKAYKEQKMDPRWGAITRPLMKWLNSIGRNHGPSSRPVKTDVLVRIFPELNGTPSVACYHHPTRSVEIDQSLMAEVKPEDVGDDSFCEKHPKAAAGCIHERCHSLWAVDLAKLFKTCGVEHLDIHLMLDEGRCESLTWPLLTTMQKNALRVGIMDYVLYGISHTEEGIDLSGKDLAIRLWGLISARIDSGIIDPENEKIEAITKSVYECIGEEYTEELSLLARKYAAIYNAQYSHAEAEMADIREKWMALVKKILADDEEPKGDDPWVDLPGGGGGDEESPTEPPPFGPKDPCEEGEEGEDGATGKGKTKAETGEEEGDEDGGGGSEPGEDEGDEDSESGEDSGEDSGRNKNGGKGEKGEEPTDDQPEEASEDGEGDQGRRKNSEGGGVGKYNSIDDRHDADFGVIDFDNPEELTKILKKAGAEMKDESLKIIKVQATTLRRADAEDNRHRMAEKRRARIEWRNRTRRK